MQLNKNWCNLRTYNIPMSVKSVKSTKLSEEKSMRHKFQQYWSIIKAYKEKHLTIPSKSETRIALQDALSHAKLEELQTIAQVLGIDSRNVSLEKLRLQIFDKVFTVIYSPAIKGWNTMAKWGFLLVLYYMFTIILEKTKGDDRFLPIRALHSTTNILSWILTLFGIHLTLKFLWNLKSSWSLRRTIHQILSDMKTSIQPPFKKKLTSPTKSAAKSAKRTKSAAKSVAKTVKRTKSAKRVGKLKTG